MSGQLNFDRQDYDITQIAQPGIPFAVHSFWRSGRNLYATKKHSFVALSCVLFILVLFAGSNPTFAQKCDIDGPSILPRRVAAELKREIKNLVREEDYEEAWAKSQKLMTGYQHYWDQQDRVLRLMAQIALADPDVKENGKARLELLIDILSQFTERIHNVRTRRINTQLDYGGEYSVLSQNSFMLVVLATVCGEQKIAADLLDKVYGFTWRADLSGYKDLIKQRKQLVNRLVHYLVIFGKAEKATRLLQRHWHFFEGEEANTPHAVRGLALLRVGKILEKQGNVPIAATFFARAVDHFERAGENVDDQPARVKKAEAIAKARVNEHGLWAQLKKERVTYEDHDILEKRFQQLANKFAKAWSNRNVEAALKVLQHRKNQREKISRIFTRSHFYSIQWSLGPVRPVKTTDKRVPVVCEFEVVSKASGGYSGIDVLVFVRDNGSWKIRFLAKEGEFDED